ncbi:MAG TPA: S41 family peptidase [Ferruginibacter sp.]|nr:S41 family peptidase [Ferruginibacter sp.]
MHWFPPSTLLSRLLPAIFSLFVCMSVQGQRKVLYQQDPPPGFAASKIAKQWLKEDMLYWQKVMEESHVNPYHAISKKQMNQLQENILAELPDSVTHFEACFAISRLVGALDEGHLGFATNRVSDSLYAYHCVRFPYLLFDIDNGALVVQRDLSVANKLPAFSRITEINGIPVQQLYDKYATLYGGLEPWKRLQVKNNIRKLLYMDGIISPFRIKATVNGQTLEFITEGYTYQQADSISKLIVAELSVPNKPFSVSFPGNNIALIEFNNMNGKLRDSFDVFLRSTFQQVKEKNIAGLIIDLRKNGGGDSGLGDMLIGYISGKRYRNASGMKMRISSHSKAYAALVGAEDPFREKKNGRLYSYKSTRLVESAQNDLRYTGKTAVLIGTGTFSSANMLTNAIKDYQLATLIGEQTAEPANDFGEIFPFMLPHTYIVATASIKMFLRANGDEKDFTGIKPDIEVVNTLSDIQQKKDRVMERAVQWVLSGN